jgi:trigger factor
VEIPASDEGDAAREQRLRIELTRAMRPEPPELDDDFVRSLGEQFGNLDALRARIRQDLEEEEATEAERDTRRQLLDRILEANPFDAPDYMVDRYLDRVLPMREGAEAERITEVRTQARPAAEQAIKRMLVIERVAEAESLRATQEEGDARVEEIALRQKRDPGEVWAQLQKSGRLESLEEEITERKVLEFLKSKSTIE